MELNLENKVIIYTGAAGYIGSYACEELAKSGAKLVLIDPNIKKLLLLKTKLEKLTSEKNILISSDINTLDSSNVDDLLDLVLKQFSKIDCLVNCAYPRTADWSLKFEQIPMNSWQENINNHLNSYFLLSQRTALKMINQKYGNIINFSSIYGLVGPNFSVYPETTNMTMPAAYSAIKGAITNLTRYMASYLGKYNIRVNAICPGGVKDSQNIEFIKAYEGLVPLSRMAEVKDIVGPLLFLISDLSSYISGVNLPVDGGWTSI